MGRAEVEARGRKPDEEEDEAELVDATGWLVMSASDEEVEDFIVLV